MNALLLLLSLGSLDAGAPLTRPLLALSSSSPVRQESRQDLFWASQPQQPVDWPKLDPRDPSSAKLGSSTTRQVGANGKAPAIRGSQLDSAVPSYQKAPSRDGWSSKEEEERLQASRKTPVKQDEESAIPSRETTRSKFAGRNRSADEDETRPTSSRPRYGESLKAPSSDQELEFTPTSRMKTSVPRQNQGSRETAQSPFVFRPASVSDDPEESERNAPYAPFAVERSDGEDDFGAEPYSAPLGSGPRNDERLASNRGGVRDTRYSAEDGGDSTLQGGSQVPGNGAESSMWGSVILVLLLFASMGGNLYLAWVAREFYERYRSLAQQVRSARNNLT